LDGETLIFAETSPAVRATRRWCASLKAASSCDANSIVLVNGSGTDEYHIATVIGVQVVEHHHERVRFFSKVEVADALEQEKSHSRSSQVANRPTHSGLVVLDELGYLSFSASGRRARGKSA
jgi:DNA replication protein DnaC